jgi:hypothetical protein
MSNLAIFTIISVIFSVSACSDDDDECIGMIETVPGEAVVHYPIGMPIEWSTNPPVTGSHFEHWAKWDRHYTSLERGFWVHNAEHGGVILLYRCPEGCPDIVDSLLDVVRALPSDAPRPEDPYGNCVLPVRNRLLVAADPLLPPQVQVAAVSWNVSYTAKCFNSSEITTFIEEHYNQSPEDVCVDGLVDLGGTYIDQP